MRPSAASAWISFQKSRRALGSTPAVGSSSSSSCGLGKRAGAERQPLLPAAGKLAGELLLAAFQAEPLDHVARGAARVAHAVEPRDEFQVLAHRKILIQAEALRHVADLALDLVGVAADVVAEAGALAAVGRQQAAEHADGGGLAGAVGAEEAVDRCRASPASTGHARPRGRRTISTGPGRRWRCRARTGWPRVIVAPPPASWR